jgi:glycosyltransferase involved in cell wall biosynthesis
MQRVALPSMQEQWLPGGSGWAIHAAASSLSIVVPAHNGGETLARCLAALRHAEPEAELIVVDDASVPDLRAIAEAAGATYLRLQKQSGPAAARNAGWRAAHGSVILFVDSDVVVSSTVVEKMCRQMASDPGLAGIFGSYDDAPAEPAFYSQFRNLLHHYVHQNSNEVASTFWTGFGGLRKGALERAGGFNEHIKGMEDVDLGMRLTARGSRLRLDKSLQVQHLKGWKLLQAARTDIFLRAAPWSRLLAESGQIRNDLNLTYGARFSAAFLLALTSVAAVALASTTGLIRWPAGPFWGLAFFLIAGLLVLNGKFYGFLVRKRGVLFTCAAIPAHWFYYLCGGVAFGVTWMLASRFGSFARYCLRMGAAPGVVSE